MILCTAQFDVQNTVDRLVLQRSQGFALESKHLILCSSRVVLPAPIQLSNKLILLFQCIRASGQFDLLLVRVLLYSLAISCPSKPSPPPDC